MADADDTKPTAGDATTRWLDETLWREPPSTKHLRKFRPRVRAAVPTALSDALAAIDAIRLSGVPEAAEVVGGERLESGDWALAPENAGDFAIVAPPDADAARINLSIELTGREAADGEVISLLGGIEVELPSTRRGPLFHDLPDMQQARAREAAQRKAQAAAEAAARKAEAEQAAAAKADAEKAEAKKVEPAEPEPAKAPPPAAAPPKETPPKPAARRTANRPVARMKQATPAAPAPEAPAAKPTRRRTAVMKPTPATETPPAKAEKPENPPPAKAVRRRTAVMKPTPAPALSEEPAAPKTSGAKWSKPPQPVAAPRKPSPRAKPTAEAKPKPTPDADTAAPKKSGVKWSKPPARRQPPRSTPEPATPVATTDCIAIELGGAPEVGDPHFRIFVDGAQVLDGNIDWGLGMPAADGDDDGLCWQTREILWDFADGFPDEIAISYDNGGPDESAAGTLLVRTIDVGGLAIDADGPFAEYPDGRTTWAGQGAERGSWVGVLQIDVAGARQARDGGGPDKPQAKTEAEQPEAPETELEPVARPQDAARETKTVEADDVAAPLVLRPDASDLANPAVMASFGRLRAYIQGHGSDDGTLTPMLAHLGFDENKWSDLLVLDPTGIPVPIDGTPPPPMPEFGSQFSADDVDAAMERLRSLPDTEDFDDEFFAPEPDDILSSTEAVLAPLTQAGEELRDVFLAERLVRAETEKRNRQALVPETAPAAAPETEPPADWTPLPATEGLRVRESFLTAWEIRADSRVQDHLANVGAAASAAPEVEAALPEANIANGDRSIGTGIGQAFLTQHLKHALEVLHAPRGAHEAPPSPLSPHAEGDVISGSFLDEMIDRAKARISPENGAAPA